MRESETRPEVHRFGIFVVTSGTSALVNALVRLGLSSVVPYEAAISGAYLVSTTLAFLLARRFAFDGRGVSWRVQLPRFVLVNISGYLQVLGISLVLVTRVMPLVGWTWHPETVAHICALASLAFTSYTLHRLFSFRVTR